jgi:uncharacterized protein
MKMVEEPVHLDVPSRALVTGDTHVRSGRPVLPQQLLSELEKTDLIIHTGDFCDLQTYRQLAMHCPVFAVAGNNEDMDLAAELPERCRICLGSRGVLVTHGHQERGSSAKKAVQSAYAGNEDLVIFGHSHQPCWEEVDGTWFLNPGSPTMRRREPEFSFAVLEVDTSHCLNVSFMTFR